jgi:hypothetical protein
MVSDAAVIALQPARDDVTTDDGLYPAASDGVRKNVKAEHDR